jgi:hypothetical protein
MKFGTRDGHRYNQDTTCRSLGPEGKSHKIDEKGALMS